MLKQYQWPGNIRELQNVLEREAILNNGPILECKTKLAVKRNQTDVKLESLAEIEKSHILAVLKVCRWRIGGEQGAAEILGMPDSTLRSRMKKLGISRPV